MPAYTLPAITLHLYATYAMPPFDTAPLMLSRDADVFDDCLMLLRHYVAAMPYAITHYY